MYNKGDKVRIKENCNFKEDVGKIATIVEYNRGNNLYVAELKIQGRTVVAEFFEDELELVEKVDTCISGKMSLPSQGEVDVKVELKESHQGKVLCLHFPKGTNTSNWYHSVNIDCSL